MGHKFLNTQLLADRFAAKGYFTVVPDLFHGDPIPLDAPEDLNIMSWLNGSNEKKGHLHPRVDPVVSSVINALRSTHGVKKLGGVGYCFGAKYVIRFLHPNNKSSSSTSPTLDTGFLAHPSFVTVEELKAISGPLSIAAADSDPVFSVQKRRESEDILMEKGDLPWQICLYSGVGHGFAVRCDEENSREKFAMDQAFQQAVAWFDDYLVEE